MKKMKMMKTTTKVKTKLFFQKFFKKFFTYLFFILPIILLFKTIFSSYCHDNWSFMAFSQEFLSHIPIFGSSIIKTGNWVYLSPDVIKDNQYLGNLLFVAGMGNCLGNVIVEEYLSNVMFMDGGNSSRGGTPNPQADNSNSQGGSSSSSRWTPSIANLLNPIADNSNPQPENSNSQAGNSNPQVGNSNTNTNQNPNPNPNLSNDGGNMISGVIYPGNGFTVEGIMGGWNVRYQVDNPTNIQSFFHEGGIVNKSEENRKYAKCIYNALSHYSQLTDNKVNFPHLDENAERWHREFAQDRNPNARIKSNSQRLRKDLLDFSNGKGKHS